MVINALNCGASTYMADFEDSTSPTWFNVVDGQINMRDAVRRTISFTNPKSGKQYSLNAKVATLLVRARGWHLDEAHVLVNGEVMSGSLFDFGVFFFVNVHELLARGSAPYYYLPKMESHLEARLWNDVFLAAQDYCGVPRGSVRATCLIETLPAVFEMDEILYELREHSAGLNCGRWDYIFSYVKVLRAHSKYILPDRSQVLMTSPFMDAYVKLLIRTCHRRKTFAMGGMAAQIPIKNDEKKNTMALESVKKDKLREVLAGHDGTWVAHPALVSVAMEVFTNNMKGNNQIYYIPDAGRDVRQVDLLEPSSGTVTMAGVHENIVASLAYTEAWIRGIGCIPFNHKMEDAATAEISRTQLWQWLRHNVRTTEGTAVTPALVSDLVDKEVGNLAHSVGPANLAKSAGALLKHMMLSDKLPDFITLLAYNRIVKTKPAKL
jgi:malate synthase